MSLWKSLSKNWSKKARRRVRTVRQLRLESLEDRRVFSATPCYAEPVESEEETATAPSAEVSSETEASQSRQVDHPAPVLLVLSNQDFWYQDYADTRASLEAKGLEVVVTAATMKTARPHDNSGQGADGGLVRPDVALADASAEDYSAIVFVGGWGMAQYQYGFEGTYHNSAYNGDSVLREHVNDLVNQFVKQDKHVAAVCYGVSVLAYARLDGESLLDGRTVTGWNGAAPSNTLMLGSRQQIVSNGPTMLQSKAIGDGTTSTDDVYVDGNIITAENFDSARRFGEVVAQEILKDFRDQASESLPKPVLMVIANRDFYHREYFETRESLEAAGLKVVVAAATTETAVPHAISVVEGREPNVQPDLALADADAEDFSTIVFVGGYGAASYQYANESTYDNPAYEGSADVQAVVNDLINDFVKQDKYVTAICNGVSVLAWARVDGVSLLEGKTVAAWAHDLPTADGGVPQTTRQQIEANGATQVPSGSTGDPASAADDVIVDGLIITAENYDTAYYFGRAIAELMLEN